MVSLEDWSLQEATTALCYRRIRHKEVGHLGWLSGLRVRLLIPAQVTISWLVSSSPASGSVLTVRSLLGILSFPLSPCLSTLSLKINE